jgi:N-acetylglutamate synthase-like GNAT family acetyltransferase
LLPEVRQRGAGKALLACIEQQACSWGVKALQLHSTATGEEFFARQGYLRAGNVRSPYGVDTIFFWKQLDGTVCDTSKRKRFCGCN